METTMAQTLAEYFTGYLFQAEVRRLGAWKDKLIKLNNEAKNKQLAGFLYKGKWYQTSGLPNGRYEKVPLTFTLGPEMEKYLADENHIKLERQVIGQLLSRLLSPCTTYQDMRDALPDCLAECVPSIRQLSRTREEAWPLRDVIEAASYERSLRQYEKLKPKIEMYAATRLIY